MMHILFAVATAAATPAMAPVASTPCVVMGADAAALAKRTSVLDSLEFKVGTSTVKVCYGAPLLKGRKMVGAAAVPYGKLWRTGANEPTMIHTSGAIMVGDLMLQPGSYSLYTVPGEKSWELILNKSITQWGHESGYNDKVKEMEVGRTTVKAESNATPVERMTFTAAAGPKSTTALTLTWDGAKVVIPVMAH
jgi:hypothetical protein